MIEMEDDESDTIGKEIWLTIITAFVPFVFYKQVSMLFINMFAFLHSPLGIDVTEFWYYTERTGLSGSLEIVYGVYIAIIVIITLFTFGFISLVVKNLINKNSYFKNFENIESEIMLSFFVIVYMYFVVSCITVVNYLYIG